MNVSDERLAPAIRPDRERAGRLMSALGWLKQGYDYARELGQDDWSFAVEIHLLRSERLTDNDLRWLVCRGFVEHAGEVTALGDDARSFRETGRLRFCRKTCFVLTEPGAEFYRAAYAEADPYATTVPAAAPAAGASPCWDADRQELRFAGRVVKQFKVPAPNQEIILATFQEEAWPHRVDDPLPPLADTDPKRRLHDTINSLNRSQKHPLLRFLGDGSGQGVRWEPVEIVATIEPAPPPSNGRLPIARPMLAKGFEDPESARRAGGSRPCHDPAAEVQQPRPSRRGSRVGLRPAVPVWGARRRAPAGIRELGGPNSR